ncbi:hypothetical protein GCM10023107_72970 [Actinoplanes octamycinicus]|nr:hypothetical protein Aoc01nite_61910 [Actinoplanes octamycinicus]
MLPFERVQLCTGVRSRRHVSPALRHQLIPSVDQACPHHLDVSTYPPHRLRSDGTGIVVLCMATLDQPECSQFRPYPLTIATEIPVEKTHTE